MDKNHLIADAIDKINNPLITYIHKNKLIKLTAEDILSYSTDIPKIYDIRQNSIGSYLYAGHYENILQMPLPFPSVGYGDHNFKNHHYFTKREHRLLEYRPRDFKEAKYVPVFVFSESKLTKKDLQTILRTGVTTIEIFYQIGRTIAFSKGNRVVLEKANNVDSVNRDFQTVCESEDKSTTEFIPINYNWLYVILGFIVIALITLFITYR